MDEPTAALNEMEARSLFRVVRQLKNQGVTVLYISHRLNEIFEVADSVTVLKDGKLVGTEPVSDLTEDEIVHMMIGRELTDYYPPRDTATEEIIFRAVNVRLGDKLHGVDLTLHKGEILGIAGLEGQGQRELARVLFGDIHCDGGDFFLDGQSIGIGSPSQAIDAGLGFISDDRKNDGLVLIRSVRENISLPTIEGYTAGGVFIKERDELDHVRRMIDQLDIRVSGHEQMVRNLSGGNQQKVVVAKWLGVDPRVLVVAEPTRGIDVGSKSEIHHILRDLAGQGVGIVMVSSEMPEVLGMSDRILVMREGRIVADIPGSIATEEMIMTAATNASESKEYGSRTV
jgi:ribose transport system ATP-binding protein